MGDFAIAWRTATGQPISEELRDARRGFDRRGVRRISRAMRRGERLSDPRDARLAVALAREHLRHDRVSGTPMMVFFGVIVVVWWIAGVGYLGEEKPVLGVVFLAFALFGTYTLVMRPRWNRGARQTLAHHDAEPGRPTVLAKPPRESLYLGMALSLVFYTVAFGLLTSMADGGRVTPARVVQEGILFGILMTIANQVWLRRRHARRS